MKISYYTVDDLADIAEAKTLEKLVVIAITVLSRMPEPIYWVAGPITSGPLSVKENKKRLRDTIERFKIKGLTTLNYLPLRKQAIKILQGQFKQEKLRDKLYAPIFQSGKIEGLCVMPHSEMSLNVQWMRGFFHASGMTIKKIPERLVPK